MLCEVQNETMNVINIDESNDDSNSKNNTLTQDNLPHDIKEDDTENEAPDISQNNLPHDIKEDDTQNVNQSQDILQNGIEKDESNVVENEEKELENVIEKQPKTQDILLDHDKCEEKIVMEDDSASTENLREENEVHQDRKLENQVVVYGKSKEKAIVEYDSTSSESESEEKIIVEQTLISSEIQKEQQDLTTDQKMVSIPLKTPEKLDSTATQNTDLPDSSTKLETKTEETNHERIVTPIPSSESLTEITDKSPEDLTLLDTQTKVPAIPSTHIVEIDENRSTETKQEVITTETSDKSKEAPVLVIQEENTTEDRILDEDMEIEPPIEKQEQDDTPTPVSAFLEGTF